MRNLVNTIKSTDKLTLIGLSLVTSVIIPFSSLVIYTVIMNSLQNI